MEASREEMAVDEVLGFPKAYARLCRSPAISPFADGPPFTFIPYSLRSQESLRMKELNQIFPVIDPDACFSADPRGYVDLLWEQLDHLGNAGLDPALFRVDPFGNVLYLNADSASPLAWNIDHWFPCSRGGKTVPGNLRILQWQVCREKKNRLDFLIPWWELQLGITVNHFLLIFASRNSDFRSRAFSFLFPNGEGEEFNALHNVKSHSFPRKFVDDKRKLGLASAAIVSSQNSSDAQVLKAVDLNRSLRHNSPWPAARKSLNKEDAADQAVLRFRTSISKENYQPALQNCENNRHPSISSSVRDSPKQRGEARKHQREINQLDEELIELKKKNDVERIGLQDLEVVLIRRRSRVEKCRRLSQAQASYRALLEKMIRDAMHESVVYKEQLRQNQAASSYLIARLEAQRAICDSSENELRRKYKQRDELEIQVSAQCEQARKMSRIRDARLDDFHDKGSRLSSSTRRAWKPTRKELRVFLEEEQKASEADISLSFNEWEDEKADNEFVLTEEPRCRQSSRRLEKRIEKDGELGEGSSKRTNESLKRWQLPLSPDEGEEEKDEEYRNRVGKGLVEKWLQVLLENVKEGSTTGSSSTPRSYAQLET